MQTKKKLFLPLSAKQETKEEKINFPLKVGSLVKGTIIALRQEGVYLDLGGLATGIVRGPELIDESNQLSSFKKGNQVSATVIDPENEQGLIELSFRHAGHKRVWDNLKTIYQTKKNISVKVIDANRGGLIVKYGKIQGFLPVSQLKPEHYPKVKDGDKTKILEKLKVFVGKELTVKIIGFNSIEENLVFSEKQLKEGERKKHQIGDVVKVKITGLADFGAFATFDKGFEGLIHISELSWKRIEKPEEIVKPGAIVKAKIINFANDGKASLSLKALQPDPWEKVTEKYHLNQIVKGKILKVKPFGLFVNLDQNIHGLAHISEIPLEKGETLEKFKEGEEYQFKIVSLEPEDHRLSLSLIADKK